MATTVLAPASSPAVIRGAQDQMAAAVAQGQADLATLQNPNVTLTDIVPILERVVTSLITLTMATDAIGKTAGAIPTS
jgi:hypothetical protein